MKKYQKFLSEVTRDEKGHERPTHERLLKAERSLLKLIQEKIMFTYLDPELCKGFTAPSTNNRIEGGVNSRLREMLRNHRGLSIERRIKAVYWWCYMHSPEPLSLTEILKVMPTDKSIAAIYERMNEKVLFQPMFDGVTYKDDIFVSINGKAYLINRREAYKKPIYIPRCVYDIIKESEKNLLELNTVKSGLSKSYENSIEKLN